jgi:glycosyltransferase involved in cell wall biosynthesis
MNKKSVQNMPLISVIIPCYNTEEYVMDTIHSLLKQTYTHWEAIFVNDASPDDIEQTLLKWTAKDARFKLVTNAKNLGLAKSRIAGIQQSTGKYIFPLDSDDYIEASYFEKAIEILEKDDAIEVLYADTMKFGAVNQLFKLQEYSFEYLLLKNCIVASAFFRRTTYDAVGGYCKDLFFLEDWDLWISILKRGGKVYKIREALFFYRVRNSDSLVDTMFQDPEKYKNHLDIIFKRHQEAFLKHIGNPILIKRRYDDLTRDQQKKGFVNFLKKTFLKN